MKKNQAGESPAVYCVIGPVIGLVTATTARILVETNVPTKVVFTIKAVDNDSEAHTQSIQSPANRPRCIVFENLLPGTVYKLKINLPCPGLTRAGFKTLPAGTDWQLDSMRVAFVNRTSFTFIRDEVLNPNDLWKHLLKAIGKNELDYIIHIGDNVYIDNDEYRHFQGQREFIGDIMDNAWQLAIRSLHVKKHANYKHYTEDICELFRSCYRRHWNYNLIKQVLATVPNIMFLNEYEICVGFGDLKQDHDRSSVENFVASCAYQVYLEYQYSLVQDLDWASLNGRSPLSVVDKAHQIIDLGAIGIIYTDVRYNHIFHLEHSKYTDGVSDYPLLGKQQLEDFQEALNTSKGILSKAKMLFVITPRPICLLGTNDDSSVKEDLYIPRTGSWWLQEHLHETQHVLSTIFDWRHRRTECEVCIVSGGTGQGMYTEISSKLHLSPVERDRIDSIKQFMIGPISAPSVAGYFKKLMARLMGWRSRPLSKNIYFSHHGLSSHYRQYGLAEVNFNYTKSQKPERESEKITKYTFYCYGVSDEKKVSSSKPIDSSSQTSGLLDLDLLSCCGTNIFRLFPTIPGLHQERVKQG